MIRRTFTWLSVGLALGLIGAMWFGPTFIQWWWKVPGTANGGFTNQCICDPQIASATDWLVKLQLGVGVAGGVVMAIIANVVARMRANRSTTSSASAPAPQ